MFTIWITDSQTQKRHKKKHQNHLNQSSLNLPKIQVDEWHPAGGLPTSRPHLIHNGFGLGEFRANELMC